MKRKLQLKREMISGLKELKEQGVKLCYLYSHHFRTEKKDYNLERDFNLVYAGYIKDSSEMIIIPQEKEGFPISGRSLIYYVDGKSNVQIFPDAVRNMMILPNGRRITMLRDSPQIINTYLRNKVKINLEEI